MRPIPLIIRILRRTAVAPLTRAPQLRRLLSNAAQPVPVSTIVPGPIPGVSPTAVRGSGSRSGPATSPGAIKLRPYQEESIEAVISHVKLGHRRLGISLATGAGKTVIFTRLIDRLQPPNSKATQTLILVHRRELVEQALKHCILAYPDKVIEVEMANKHATGAADITIASIASIVSKDRLAKFNPRRFKLILIDEAHHGVARTYLSCLDHFGVLKPKKGKFHPVLVGVSATLSRFDGLKLGAILDYIVYHKDYVEMIKDNWLADVMFTTVHTKIDLSTVRTNGPAGDFNIGDLSAAVNTTQTNEVTVRSWLEKTERKRKSTLVFCVDIAHVIEMTKTFRNHGIDARFITSNTPKEERGSRLDEFRRGEYPVLVNCGIFTEGTDIPNIDCVLLARPTRSKNLLIQMIGRGMRLHTDKRNCHVIDMVSSVDKGIITVPTLFGLDPFEIVTDATPKQMEAEAEAKAKAKEELASKQLDFMPGQPYTHSPQGPGGGGVSSPDPATSSLDGVSVHFTDYETIFDLLADNSVDNYIRKISQFAWVKVAPDKYVLSASKLGHLRIEKDEDPSGGGSGVTYTCTETRVGLPKLLLDPGRGAFTKLRPRVIVASVPDLEQTVRGADTFAAARYPRNLLLHSAPWRNAPASENQLAHLNKVKPDGDWEGRKLTKGQAADLTTRIKFGGASSWGKELNKAKREVAKILKEEERVKKAEVKVGKIEV